MGWRKMPWLAIHIAVPAFLLIVTGTMQIITGVTKPIGRNAWLVPGITLLALASLAVGMAQLSGGTNQCPRHISVVDYCRVIVWIVLFGEQQ
jgi:hypothetical protein